MNSYDRFLGRMAVSLALFTGLTLLLPDALASKPGPRREVSPSGPAYGQRSDVQELADRLAAQHALPKAWVRQQLGQARQIQSIARLVLPPAVGQRKNWAAYRDRFV